MRKHQFLYAISLSLAIIVFASCLNNNRNGEKNETTCLSLSQKDWRVWAFDDVTIINLMGVFSEVDTFDVHEVIGVNYANSDTLKIKFLTGYDIVSAEKVTCYYPTIWSGSNDNVMQFIYFFNLCYKDTLPLNIQSGVIVYPLKRKGSESGFLQYFGSITQSQLLASIDRVPEEHNRKNTSLNYKSNSWKSDAEVWKRIAGSYTPGELIDEDNEPFDVDPYEIRLMVTFRKGDSLFAKMFCDEAVIGN